MVHQEYRVLRGFVNADIRQFILDYVLLRNELGAMSPPDARVADAKRLYADLVTETLLKQKHPEIQQLLGEAVWPSYSYLRLHSRGASMPIHTDRDGSEIGVSICIDTDVDWPLWFRTSQGDSPVVMKPGDAVVYEGRKLPHWRETYEGSRQVQCMLFYVRQLGECARWRFDGRSSVGQLPPRPAETKVGLVPAAS